MHDPTMPSTTACPYLPGQAVNTMHVPMERGLRQRSASLSSMRLTDFKTVNPQSRFVTPRRSPPVPAEMATSRIATAPKPLQNTSTSRPASPTPAWRRLFARRAPSVEADRGRSTASSYQEEPSPERPMTSRSSSTTGRSRASSTISEGSRSRDISPESLRRFLSDDSNGHQESKLAERPSLIIPEDIAEEGDEDDENFATSATALTFETHSLATVLSPPPIKRSWSSDSSPLTVTNLSNLTLATARPGSRSEPSSDTSRSDLPKLDTTSTTPSSFLSSASSVVSPASPRSPRDMPSFFDDSMDDDDLSACNGVMGLPESMPVSFSSLQAFDAYRLPRTNFSAKFEIHSPDVLPQQDGKTILDGSNLLGSSIDTGLDSFASELRWMADTISSRQA